MRYTRNVRKLRKRKSRRGGSWLFPTAEEKEASRIKAEEAKIKAQNTSEFEHLRNVAMNREAPIDPYGR